MWYYNKHGTVIKSVPNRVWGISEHALINPQWYATIFNDDISEDIVKKCIKNDINLIMYDTYVSPYKVIKTGMGYIVGRLALYGDTIKIMSRISKYYNTYEEAYDKLLHI